MITYLAGIMLPALLPSLQYALLLALILALGCLWRRWRNYLLTLVLGVCIASSYGAWQLHHRLDQPRIDVTLSGEVVGLPVSRNGRLQFVLGISQVLTDSQTSIRLRKVKLSDYESDVELRTGDQVVVRVRLKPPRGLYNPEAFDLERHYLASGLDARGYVREWVELKSSAPGPWQWRQMLRDHFTEHYDRTAATTLMALVLGERVVFTDRERDVLRITGTAHLMVVSGLHVAVVAGFAWFLGRLAAAVCAGVTGNRACIRVLPLVFVVALVTVYAWLAGWGLPVQRAWLMMLVFVLGSWRLFQLTAWQRWRWALVVVVSIQPLAVLEAGTWLSFTAVALIILASQSGASVKRWTDMPAAWAKIQLSLFLGMLPITVLYFQQFNPLGILVNLIAVPLLTMVVWVLPLVLPLAVSLPALRGHVEAFIAQYWQGLEWAADVAGLYMTTIKPEAVLVFLLLVIGCCALLPLGWLYRLLACVGFLPLLWVKQTPLENGRFEALVFDVGQGQAVLVKTAAGNVLYDTGPGYRSGGAAFDYAIAPYLRAEGINQLHTLILSHDDMDHSGGYEALLREVQVDRLLAGEPEQRKGSIACVDQRWIMGGTEFRVLPAYSGSTEALASNERSCVLSVRNEKCSLLLTGDLGHSGEYRLLSAGRVQPHTWLIAGHHGSRDSTSNELLEQVQPRRVLISAGFANHFGHPHPEVLQRLGAHKIPWVETGNAGAITLSANADGCLLSQHRQTKKRYWTAG